MAKQLDPKIAEILKSFGFDRNACWDCHGTWVVYHRVIEQIAAMAKIAFDPPIVLEANSPAKCAAICVTGRMGDKAEWSIGEAAPGNNKNSYPYAMAEKRAKDRVVLKLIGLHGLAYSEDEADDFTPAAAAPAEPAHTPLFLELSGLLSAIVTDEGLAEWAARTKAASALSTHERQELRLLYQEQKAYIEQLKKAA